MLQFVRPARSSWGLLGDNRLAGMDESGGRIHWPNRINFSIEGRTAGRHCAYLGITCCIPRLLESTWWGAVSVTEATWLARLPSTRSTKRVRQMPNDTANQIAQDNLTLPVCLKCRGRMSLTCTEEEYPGYKRQTFECPVCGGTMTQWASVSPASN